MNVQYHEDTSSRNVFDVTCKATAIRDLTSPDGGYAQYAQAMSIHGQAPVLRCCELLSPLTNT